MPRWVVYKTTVGRMVRHGHVAVANDLGTVAGDETAVQNSMLFLSWQHLGTVIAGMPRSSVILLVPPHLSV